jgi:ABC-type transport system involved in multi-copper enzyme maturation permease subunit
MSSATYGSNTLVMAFRGPWTVARYTFREGIRKKLLVGFLILSLLVIFGSSFMAAFLDPTMVGDVQSDINLKLIKDICVTTISIFGVLITIFMSAMAVPGELENKVVYTVLSKPLRRFQYLAGKFLGIQLIIIVNLALMGGLFFMVLWLRQGVLPTLLLWSVFLTYFEFLIVSAFTFALSCAATSAVLPSIGGLFIWIVGTLTEYLSYVQVRSGWQVNEWANLFQDFTMQKLVGATAFLLRNVLPNLQYFSLKTQILEKMPNDPPTDVMIPKLVMYGLAYAVSGFILAYWIFRKKEL